MIPPPPGAIAAAGAWTIRPPGTLGIVDTIEVGSAVWARHWRQLALLSFALGGWVALAASVVDPGPSIREVIRSRIERHDPA